MKTTDPVKSIIDEVRNIREGVEPELFRPRLIMEDWKTHIHEDILNTPVYAYDKTQAAVMYGMTILHACRTKFNLYNAHKIVAPLFVECNGVIFAVLGPDDHVVISAKDMTPMFEDMPELMNILSGMDCLIEPESEDIEADLDETELKIWKSLLARIARGL